MSPTPPPGTEPDTARVPESRTGGTTGTPARGRRRALLAIALLVGAATGLWLLRDAGNGALTKPAGWQNCHGDTSCIQTAIAAELADGDARHTLEAALAVFEKEPTTPPGCHGIAHYIGRAIAASGERTPTLGTLWATCGYGALHGVFETLPLPPDPRDAGTAAYSKCRENEEISTNRDLMSRCVHALGHSVYTAMQGDLDKAVTACRTEPDQDSAQQCLGGVFMMDRNARWPAGKGPGDAAAWRAALPHCDDPETAAICILSYAEVATFTSETSTLGWLDLCFAADRGTATVGHRERCLLFVGQGAAFDHIAKGSGPGIETCLAYAAKNAPELGDACLRGVENALAAAGTPAERRPALTCEILAESRRRCA